MAKQNPQDQAQAHEVHTSADGRYRWVDDGQGGVWRHDQRFYGAARDAHPESQGGQHVPLSMVKLVCTCPDEVRADIEKLKQAHGLNETGGLNHCPGAEVDMAESFALSTDFDAMNP